jgi:PAS domain S-box-containing protein
MSLEIHYSELERVLIENCQAGTFITTLDGKLVDCNQSFAEIFGYESKEVILSVNAVSFYSNKFDREVYLEELRRNGKVRKYVVKAAKKNGELIYHSINSDLYVDEEGKSYVVGSVLDVTESLLSKIELKDSERRYKDLFENSLDLIQSFDKDGKMLFCNAVWHEKLEYSKSDLKTLNLFDIIAEEYKTHCNLMFQDVMMGKSIKDVEVIFISKSGRRILLEGNIVPIFINQELKATHAFFRDITEKSLARQKIKEQEQLLQTIFNTVPICLYVKDDSGRYVISNETMASTLGCNVIGRLDNEVFPSENFHQLQLTDKSAIERPDQIIKYEISVSMKEAQKNFFCGKKAIFNPISGKFDLFGFSVDITELKNSTRKIEESENLLQYVLTNIEGGFLLFTLNEAQGRFLLNYHNAMAKSVVHPHELQDDFDKIFDFIDAAERKLLTSVDGTNFNSFVYEWHRNSDLTGESEVFQIRFVRILDSTPKIIVNLKNITEQKKLISDLEKNLKENEVLMGEVHHRVKNNLAIIDGILELKKHKINDAELQRNLFDIQSRIKSIALVHEKLYQSEHFSHVKIKEYLNEMANHYKRMFDSDKSKQIDFKFSVPDGVSLNMSKSISFGLLLSELISNSCKYGILENKVLITISMENNAGELRLSYFDSGNNWNPTIKNLRQGGFGLRLIENLIKQLRATYQLGSSSGFSFEMKFQA